MNGYEKMREALEEARDALDTIMSTSCHNLREITASRAYRKCREALAAPTRNCDRFATVKDAAIAFSKFRNNPHPCPDFTFSAWLMSATEEGAEA